MASKHHCSDTYSIYNAIYHAKITSLCFFQDTEIKYTLITKNYSTDLYMIMIYYVTVTEYTRVT